MKKKLLTMMLAGGMALSLTACGQSGTAQGDGAAQTAAPAEEAPAEAPAPTEAEAESQPTGETSAEAAGETAADAAATTAEAEAPAEEAAPESGDVTTGASDVEYIKGKGTLVVGITDFKPMDYQEGGEWIGFDADVAREVAKSLGVEVQFVEIDWDNKILELNNKSIDCVWNGMTLTDEVKSAMECTNPYCNNAQVTVVPSVQAGTYADVESMKELTFAVEAGSAGEAAAKENGLNYTAVSTQGDALMEVQAGTSDSAIIDLLMAGAMIGEGTSYPDLTHSLELTTEEYGVGCRKGSDLAAYINDQFTAMAGTGALQEIAVKYGVQESLIVK